MTKKILPIQKWCWKLTDKHNYKNQILFFKFKTVVIWSIYKTKFKHFQNITIQKTNSYSKLPNYYSDLIVTVFTGTEPSSQAVKTIRHVNHFSRKLQRRLTRRTIAEAKLLKKQGYDTIQCFVYFADLVSIKVYNIKTYNMYVEFDQNFRILYDYVWVGRERTRFLKIWFLRLFKIPIFKIIKVYT